jgi:hypothetical protein
MLLLALTAGGLHGLEWKTNASVRVAELIVPASGRAGFREMPASATGLDFTNHLADKRGLTNGIFCAGRSLRGISMATASANLYLCAQIANALLQSRRLEL